MKFTNYLTTLFFMTLATLAFALPIVQRDVWDPTVILPSSTTVWVIGQQEPVTWDTSNAPVNVTNTIGEVRLRKGLFPLNIILASNFSIFLGSVEVTVPNVEPGDDYSVVLFGDSGNFGPTFTITA